MVISTLTILPHILCSEPGVPSAVILPGFDVGAVETLVVAAWTQQGVARLAAFAALQAEYCATPQLNGPKCADRAAECFHNCGLKHCGSGSSEGKNDSAATLSKCWHTDFGGSPEGA